MHGTSILNAIKSFPKAFGPELSDAPHCIKNSFSSLARMYPGARCRVDLMATFMWASDGARDDAHPIHRPARLSQIRKSRGDAGKMAGGKPRSGAIPGFDKHGQQPF